MATSVWIESRSGEGADFPRITVPPTACNRATSGPQKPDARDLADEAGPLEVCFKESLVKRGDLLASFEVRPIEPDEITILGKLSRIGLATALVPGIHQLFIKRTNGGFVIRL